MALRYTQFLPNKCENYVILSTFDVHCVNNTTNNYVILCYRLPLGRAIEQNCCILFRPICTAETYIAIIDLINYQTESDIHIYHFKSDC